MSGYSVDLRERIASAVEEDGMPKAQAARTFSVSLSSVKRYVKKAKRGESLAPKKRPGDLLRSSTRRGGASLAAILKNVPTAPFRSAATTWSS